MIVLSGVMSGAHNVVEIGLWAKNKLALLQRFLPFARGPSHDKLKIVAINGKTSRRAHGSDGKALHLGLGLASVTASLRSRSDAVVLTTQQVKIRALLWERYSGR